MKRFLWLIIVALAMPSCIEHEPRNPEQVRRSEARKKRAKEHEQRQLDRAARRRQQQQAS